VKRISTLDGWRAIAILLVIADHAAGSIFAPGSDYLNYAKLGGLGVDVFFALSGILITRLLLEEHATTGRISLKAFYVRRAFRVQAPAFIYLAVLAALSLIWNRAEGLSSLFFLRNYFDTGGPYTSHLWSLAVEEHFYLIWPAVLVAVSVRYGQRAAMVGAVTIGLWRAVASHYFPGLFSGSFAPYRTDYRMDSLLWGCVFGFVLQRREALRDAVPFMFLYVAIGQFDVSAVHRLLFAVAFPLMISMTATHPEWLASKALDLAPLRYIGKISYGLYLWQGVFLVQSLTSPHWWQRSPVNIAAAFLLASASWHVVDGPLQRLGHKLAKRFKHADIVPDVVDRTGTAHAGNALQVEPLIHVAG